MLSNATMLIERYGYAAIALVVMAENLGLPVPGETIAVASGAVAATGALSPFLVWLAILIGAIVGDNVGFALGRFGGRPLIARFGPRVGITPRHYRMTEQFFDRYGGPAVAVARFIPVARAIGALVVGASGMEWRLFLPWQVSGALLWATVTVSVGYFGDRAVVRVLPTLTRVAHGWWPLVLLASLALAAFAYWGIQRWVAARTLDDGDESGDLGGDPGRAADADGDGDRP